MKHAAIIMGELQRRAQQEQTAMPSAPEHVVIEHDEDVLWRCAASDPAGFYGTRDVMQCVLIEHEGTSHMRWEGGTAVIWDE